MEQIEARSGYCMRTMLTRKTFWGGAAGLLAGGLAARWHDLDSYWGPSGGVIALGLGLGALSGLAMDWGRTRGSWLLGVLRVSAVVGLTGPVAFLGGLGGAALADHLSPYLGDTWTAKLLGLPLPVILWTAAIFLGLRLVTLKWDWAFAWQMTAAGMLSWLAALLPDQFMQPLWYLWGGLSTGLLYGLALDRAVRNHVGNVVPAR